MCVCVCVCVCVETIAPRDRDVSVSPLGEPETPVSVSPRGRQRRLPCCFPWGPEANVSPAVSPGGSQSPPGDVSPWRRRLPCLPCCLPCCLPPPQPPQAESLSGWVLMFDPRIVMAEAPEVVVMAEAKDGEIPDKKWRASLQKFLSRFRHIAVSSLIRLYSTPEQYETKEVTNSFQTLTF